MMSSHRFYAISETALPGVAVETEDVNNDGRVRSTIVVDDADGARRLYQYWHEAATAQQAQEAHDRIVASAENGDIDLCGPSRIRLHPDKYI